MALALGLNEDRSLAARIKRGRAANLRKNKNMGVRDPPIMKRLVTNREDVLFFKRDDPQRRVFGIASANIAFRNLLTSFTGTMESMASVFKVNFVIHGFIHEGRIYRRAGIIPFSRIVYIDFDDTYLVKITTRISPTAVALTKCESINSTEWQWESFPFPLTEIVEGVTDSSNMAESVAELKIDHVVTQMNEFGVPTRKSIPMYNTHLGGASARLGPVARAVDGQLKWAESNDPSPMLAQTSDKSAFPCSGCTFKLRTQTTVGFQAESDVYVGSLDALSDAFGESYTRNNESMRCIVSSLRTRNAPHKVGKVVYANPLEGGGQDVVFVAN